MSKIIILQKDIVVWERATWHEAMDILVPKIKDFCYDRFGTKWRFWDLTENEPHKSIIGKLPHAVYFDYDEDATIFLLAFK